MTKCEKGREIQNFVTKKAVSELGNSMVQISPVLQIVNDCSCWSSPIIFFFHYFESGSLVLNCFQDEKVQPLKTEVNKAPSGDKSRDTFLEGFFRFQHFRFASFEIFISPWNFHFFVDNLRHLALDVTNYLFLIPLSVEQLSLGS